MAMRLKTAEHNQTQLAQAAQDLRRAIEAERLSVPMYLCMMVGGLATVPGLNLTKKQVKCIVEYYKRHTDASVLSVARSKR